MTTAQLVNLIVRKFGGHNAEFFKIEGNACLVDIGPRHYCVDVNLDVVELVDGKSWLRTDGSLWVQGVVVGKVRNDEGVMVEA